MPSIFEEAPMPDEEFLQMSKVRGPISIVSLVPDKEEHTD
jgi:hypothetical protein